jgi:MFS family permease
MLWLAVLASDIGTWMQTVGAQWLLVDLPGAATLVALVQTADTLPDLLLALPGGALADIFDRRRLLIGLQLFQVAVGAVLTGLTLAGQMTPPLLLAFTFALGAASAMATPAYQALIPELVPRRQLPAAAALGSISVNLARAIGPAIGGVLIARGGAGLVFGLNTVAFLFLPLVMLAWRRPAEPNTVSTERLIPAMLAGGRYVRYSPTTRRTLFRLGLFVAPASAVWALLPLIATRRFGLTSDGYGLLLGALGIGAVAGAFALPWVRARLSASGLLGVAGLVYAAATALLVIVDRPALALMALLPAGAAWVSVIASANAEIQLFLPAWVRARGLASFQMVLFGSQALGALAWGLLAQYAGLGAAFLAAAVTLFVGAATIRLWPLLDVRGIDQDLSIPWGEPQLAWTPDADRGPVVVNTVYTVAEANEAAFLSAMMNVRLSRLRTGAVSWELYREGENGRRFVESFAVASWGEHLRQHRNRQTGADAALEARANAFSDPPPVVSHLFPEDSQGDD